MIELFGTLGIILSIVIGYKGQNTDFFILAGLIFIGICILQIPKLLIKVIKSIGESLNSTLDTIKNTNKEKTKE